MDKRKLYQEVVDYFGGTQHGCAKQLGVKQPTVFAWLVGLHGMSGKIALRCERMSGGRFKAADLVIDEDANDYAITK